MKIPTAKAIATPPNPFRLMPPAVYLPILPKSDLSRFVPFCPSRFVHKGYCDKIVEEHGMKRSQYIHRPVWEVE